jgi:hypothetical protein
LQEEDSYEVTVTMRVSKNGKDVDRKNVDFGKLKEEQVRGLADLFSMISANIEYIKSLTPQFERLDKSKPAYLQ